MDATIKQQWVDALRSGKYRQARGRLRDDGDAMCCLGVLCDIVAPDNWRYEEDQYRGPDGWHQDNFQMGIPENLLKTVGFEVSEPIIEYKGERQAISLVNDGGATFAEIADLIEAQW